MTSELTRNLNLWVKANIVDGTWKFEYGGDPCISSNGDIDFRIGATSRRRLRVKFKIHADSNPGVAFQEDEDAIWICLKDGVGPDGCPEGPYWGDQFTGFRTQGTTNKVLLFWNANNDRKIYRYMMRFVDGNGTEFQHDPDMENDGDPG